MLKQRLLTISLLLPALLYLILKASNLVFLIITSMVIVLAAHEWLKLLKLKPKLYYVFFILFISLIILLGIYRNYWLYDTIIINQVVVVAIIFWLVATLHVLLYGKYKKLQQLSLNSKYILIYGLCSYFLVLIPSWLAINYIKTYNQDLLLFCCLLIIVADVGAYITGKLFGKHKLTTISQGKTWEGIIGGYCGTSLVAAIYIKIFYFNSEWPVILTIMLLANIIFVFSVVGDLFESLFKRISGVKDSGNVLPGHGGILDRIDSFCSATPVFLFFMLFLNSIFPAAIGSDSSVISKEGSSFINWWTDRD